MLHRLLIVPFSHWCWGLLHLAVHPKVLWYDLVTLVLVLGMTTLNCVL